MAALDPEGVVSFEAAGRTYKALFGFRAQKEVEIRYEKPFLSAVIEIMPFAGLSEEEQANESKVTEAMARVESGKLGELLGLTLAKHHPDLAEDEIEDIFDALNVLGVIKVLMLAIFSAMGKEEDGKSAAPGPRPNRQQRRSGSRS
jgi:hypothetical protein